MKAFSMLVAAIFTIASLSAVASSAPEEAGKKETTAPADEGKQGDGAAPKEGH